MWSSLSDLEVTTAPTGVTGTFDLYSCGSYQNQAVNGLTWPAPATGGPETVRLSSTPAAGASTLDFSPLASVGADTSQLSLPGAWLDTSYTETDGNGDPYTTTISQFAPGYPSQDLGSPAIWGNPADLRRPYYNVDNPFTRLGDASAVAFALESFDSFWVYTAYQLQNHTGEWYTHDFPFWSCFKADFSQDFSFPAAAVPEELPPLQIVPDLPHGMLRLPLARAPASECELVWAVGSATSACAARGSLSVAGCGDWDAVYSGATTDREPEYQWQGTFIDQNKRWTNFDAYLAEWWQPVLTQLKTATWTVNLTQLDRYSYKIDFYYPSQVGAKNAATGRYTFTGSPAESWTVANASADDTNAGQVRITTATAVYDLNTTAPSTSVTQWSLTAHDRQSTPATFLNKNVTLTTDSSVTYGQTPGYTVVDTTSLDGHALPVVTTTYWDLSNPDHIDQISENGGTEGTRTTQYTYQWNTSEFGYLSIDHLTNIAQTGGTNPCSADYDANGLLTNYVNGSSQVQIGYNGAVATRTESFGGANVRTAQTTYSSGLTSEPPASTASRTRRRPSCSSTRATTPSIRGGRSWCAPSTAR